MYLYEFYFVPLFHRVNKILIYVAGNLNGLKEKGIGRKEKRRYGEELRDAKIELGKKKL